jgi:internalin A
MRALSRGWLVYAVALVALSGCDDPKKDTPKPAPSAAVTSVASTPQVASAVPSASAEAPKTKAPIVCGTGPELDTKDAGLAEEIRRKLGKKPGEPVKNSELATIRSLNLIKAASSSLDPCVFQKTAALKDLFLGPGELDDLSPIANLTHMETLRASINHVSDLKPLEKLVLLDRLDLGRTHIRDIKPLENLVNLTELEIDDTQVSDLSPLSKLKKLERLSIRRTLVTDVSPLKDLQKLKYLYTEGAAVSDISPLQPLTARGLKIVSK